MYIMFRSCEAGVAGRAAQADISIAGDVPIGVNQPRIRRFEPNEFTRKLPKIARYE
jgi:hypothetical protein